MVGTVAATGSGEADWSLGAVLVVIAGIGLTFGLWWVYFAVDWADALHANPARGFGWGYGHIFLYAGVAATGAGLHIAGYYMEGQREHLTPVIAVTSVALPVLVFVVSLMVLYAILLRTFDRFHLLLLSLTVAVLVVSVAMAAVGVPMGWCLIVAMLAPMVIVVGFETGGHRHLNQHLAALHTGH